MRVYTASMDLEVIVNQPYKSFKSPFKSVDLNSFVILTGKNGAGKSQLLQIIEGKQYINRSMPSCVASLNINGENPVIDDILGIFDWHMPQAPGAGMSELQTYSNQIHSAVMNIWANSLPDFNLFSRVQREELGRIATELKSLGFNNNGNLPSLDDVMSRLSANFAKQSAQIVNERIATKIYDWHFDAIENQKSYNQATNPIKIFNKLCKDFETEYHLPDLKNLRLPYVPQLENNQGDKVAWSELSSGEQVLFRIICWLFYYHVDKSLYPKLLLLDEPDAHLTPKMIHKLIGNIQNVIVDKMGIAVIMTTHSPNTVALCDEQALHELTNDNKSNHNIIKISRHEALTKFSEGLLFVQEDTRLVFVEGKDDLPFYQKLHSTSIIWHGLNTIPSMKFIAASTARPDHGGCTKVIEMVPRFIDSSIESLVHGFIDNDNSNKPQKGISVLDRYSIESYLYDPLLIAAYLVNNGKHKGLIKSMDTLETGEHVRLVNTSGLLQQVADEIIGLLESNVSAQKVIKDSGFGSKKNTVSWRIKGHKKPITYQLPEWFVRIKKKDLLSNVIRDNGSPFKDLLSDGGQYVAIETMGAIPDDIFTKLEFIQK